MKYLGKVGRDASRCMHKVGVLGIKTVLHDAAAAVVSLCLLTDPVVYHIGYKAPSKEWTAQSADPPKSGISHFYVTQIGKP